MGLIKGCLLFGQSEPNPCSTFLSPRLLPLSPRLLPLRPQLLPLSPWLLPLSPRLLLTPAPVLRSWLGGRLDYYLLSAPQGEETVSDLGGLTGRSSAYTSGSGYRRCTRSAAPSAGRSWTPCARVGAPMWPPARRGALVA